MPKRRSSVYPTKKKHTDDTEFKRFISCNRNNKFRIMFQFERLFHFPLSTSGKCKTQRRKSKEHLEIQLVFVLSLWTNLLLGFDLLRLSKRRRWASATQTFSISNETKCLCLIQIDRINAHTKTMTRHTHLKLTKRAFRRRLISVLCSREMKWDELSCEHTRWTQRFSANLSKSYQKILLHFLRYG